MKKVLSLLFVLGLTLSACGTSPTQFAPPVQTATSSPVPTITQTPIPPTATVTPLPTIPTFTPTFDVSTIVTVTPAEKAECPVINSKLQPNLELPEELTFKSPFVPDFDDMVLAFLNEGGDYHNVQKELQEFNEGSQLGLSFLPLERDITNDSIPELIFRDYSGFPIVHIFSCVKGKYVDFTPLTAANTALPVVFENITDLNTNGIPEILLSSKNWIGIYEWDGYDFILLNPGMGEGGEMYYEFLDSDNNQTKNVVLKRGYPHDEWLEFP